MTRSRFAVAALMLLLIGVAGCPAARADSRRGSFTLWQLPSQIGSIGMSYVLRTAHGRVVVVDGGMPQDASYLRGFLAAEGNRVDLWFISHPHDDHAGALNELLKAPQDLQIGTICTSLFDREWYLKVERDCIPFTEEFYGNLQKSGLKVIDAQPGMTFAVDGMRIQVLGIKNPEFTMNAYNNSSMVLKVTGGEKSVLFPGDLGVEGGRKLLASKFAAEVRADYVQMAHHGQNGVDESFYRAVHPKYCLWPTPLWLWNNDSGKGAGSGPWATLTVRKWIDALHVSKSYLSHQGLARID